MTEPDLVGALRPVAEALDALGVRYYLGGSVASSAHGIARASLDADVIAAIEPKHVDSLVGRLASAYYIPLDRLRSAVSARSSCDFIHLATMFKIDVFVSKGRPFDVQAAERSPESCHSLSALGHRHKPVCLCGSLTLPPERLSCSGWRSLAAGSTA